MKIGIYGSTEGDAKTKEKARIIGRELAKRGHIIITGGTGGLPYETVLGAREMNGETIGFSPAINIEEHKSIYHCPIDGYTQLIFIPEDYVHRKNKPICYKYRNVSSVAEIDTAIIISGRIGTMNEFTIAYDAGKNIGILANSGGITKNSIKTLLQEAKKESGSKVFFEENPIKLVNRLLSISLDKVWKKSKIKKEI